MHGLVKGLQIHIRTSRRCAEDVPHVQLTQSLYGKAFCKFGEPINKELFAEELRTTVAKLRPKSPMPQESLADVILTVSHYTRINVNAKANETLKEQHSEKQWMPWHDEHFLPGLTMQPQECWIWNILEVIGCTRKSVGHKIINGYSYSIVEFGQETVTLQVFPEFAKNLPKEKEEEEGSGDEAEVVVKQVPFQISNTMFMKQFQIAPIAPCCHYGEISANQNASRSYQLRHIVIMAQSEQIETIPNRTNCAIWSLWRNQRESKRFPSVSICAD